MREEHARRLEDMESRYRQLFDAVADPILMIDPDDRRILDANESAAREFGYSRKKLLAMRVDDLSAEPDATRAAIRRMAKNGRELAVKRTYHRADGARFPVEINASMIDFGGRRVVVAVLRDVSTRVKAEQER